MQAEAKPWFVKSMGGVESEGRYSTCPVWLSGLKFNTKICALRCMLKSTIILFA